MEKFYRKWVKGECRHFCFCCKYKFQCELNNVTLEVISISYKQGYQDGYKQAIEDMKKILSK